MFLLLPGNWFRIFTDFPNSRAAVLICHFKTAWELQTAILKLYGSYRRFFIYIISWGMYTNFHEALENPFVAALWL
jgi:hypothetical protein